MGDEVRVFVVPRVTRRNGQAVTALRCAMDETGLGAHRLERATRVGGIASVAHGTVGNLSRGVGRVEVRKARAIAAALGRPVGELFAHQADLVGDL